MQYQLNDSGRDDLAEVWHNAQHRRAEDIGMWLRHFLGRRRQLKSIDPAFDLTRTAAATLDAAQLR